MKTFNVYNRPREASDARLIGRVNLPLHNAMPFGISAVWLPLVRALPAITTAAPVMCPPPQVEFHRYKLPNGLVEEYLVVDCPCALMLVENAMRGWED